ncbi:MAG: hypothetical protein WAL13_16385 [Trebonia sp.]
MIDQDPVDIRLKFYGVNDLGTYMQLERAAEVLESYDPSSASFSISEILELYNAQLFVEGKFFPRTYTDEQRDACQALIPALRKTAGIFFNAINDANFATIIVDVSYEHHSDLLRLFEIYKVYNRCTATTVLQALEKIHMGLGTVLGSKLLVRSYDQEVRAQLISNPRNAEHVIRKYLEKDGFRAIHLPTSLTSTDSRALLEDYLDSADANPNFIELIATGQPHPDAGIDAKLKLKARRKYNAWMENFFKNKTGIKSGCEVSISDTQSEPVIISRDGLYVSFSYSRSWLEGGLDFPTVFNNFLYLFEFTNYHMLLTLPSYRANLGVLERAMSSRGEKRYLTGIMFQLKEQSSFLQLLLYERFLQTKGSGLELAIAWFFAEYLKNEFGAANLNFTPSSKTSLYLERSRHLFSEMESVAMQFALYAENGEFDPDLLSMTPEGIEYRGIPSLLPNKYVCASDDYDMRYVMRLLFSDQSGLTYISENLRARNAAELLAENKVSYEDFADHQKQDIDYLVRIGVLKSTGEQVQLADARQILIIKAIFETGAASYYHYSAETRKCIDKMVSKGWLVHRQSLLTAAEASYFNYFLNRAEFSSGPNLRNKYLHGTQARADNEEQHLRTYIEALRLLVALVIKINDEFYLRGIEENAGRKSGLQPRIVRVCRPLAAHFLKVPHAGTISIRPSASILRNAAVTADLETSYSVANSATEGRRPSCGHSSAARRARSAVSTRLLVRSANTPRRRLTIEATYDL